MRTSGKYCARSGSWGGPIGRWRRASAPAPAPWASDAAGEGGRRDEWAAVEAMATSELEARLYPSVAAAEGRAGLRVDPSRATTRRRDAGAAAPRVPRAASRRVPVHGVLRALPRWLRRRGATMRQVHLAGDKIFVDYSGKKPRIWDADDRRGDRGRALRRRARRVELHVRGGDAHAARARLDRQPHARVRVLRRRDRGDGARPAQVRRDAGVPVRARDPAHVRGAGARTTARRCCRRGRGTRATRRRSRSPCRSRSDGSSRACATRRTFRSAR